MTAVQREEFERFRAELRRLAVRDPCSQRDGFDDEFDELQRFDQEVRSNLDEFYTASMGSSLAKNRFDDVKANEGSLVRLARNPAFGNAQAYINANYVDARGAMGVPFVYIATQSPMSNTVADFWRMVYEKATGCIVMLCATREEGRMKSETYWPTLHETACFGPLEVRTIEEEVRGPLVHRRLGLRCVQWQTTQAEAERIVCHVQYVDWPDQGLPDSTAALADVMHTIAQADRATTAPVVVHCSGGVGRTGVFLAMHIALAQFDLQQTSISVPRIVRFLRACRSGMVHDREQYVFVYYAIVREMERMLRAVCRHGVSVDDSGSQRTHASSRHGSAATAPDRITGGDSRTSWRSAGRNARPFEQGHALSINAAPTLPMPNRRSTTWSASKLFHLLLRRSSRPHGSASQRNEADSTPTVHDIAAMERYLTRHGRDVRGEAATAQSTTPAPPQPSLPTYRPDNRSEPQQPPRGRQSVSVRHPTTKHDSTLTDTATTTSIMPAVHSSWRETSSKVRSGDKDSAYAEHFGDYENSRAALRHPRQSLTSLTAYSSSPHNDLELSNHVHVITAQRQPTAALQKATPMQSHDDEMQDASLTEAEMALL